MFSFFEWVMEGLQVVIVGEIESFEVGIGGGSGKNERVPLRMDLREFSK